MTESWITRMDFLHTCANPQKKKKMQTSQGLNTNMVTLRTLKQTAEGSVSWPAWERLRLPKPPGNQGQNFGSLLFWATPIPHTQTTQENCLSPFIFVHFGYASIYASSLPNPLLPAVTVFCLLLSGALESSCSCQWRPRGGGLGSGVLLGCVDSVRTRSHFYLVYRQFEQCSLSSFGKRQNWWLSFFPLLSLGEIFPPSAFLSLFVCERPMEGLVCLRFSAHLLFFVLPFFHIKHIYLSGELKLDSQSLQA